MGIIDEIKAFCRAGASASDKFNKINTRSIARGAMEQSFIFPCLIDDSNPVDLSTVLAQHLDRTYASWTQIYISSIGLIDLNYIKNPRQFIAKYQPKGFLGESADDDYLHMCMESLKDDAYGDDELLFAEESQDGMRMALFSPLENIPGTIKKQVKDLSAPRLDMFNLHPVGRTTFYEADEPDAMDMIRGVIDGQRRDSDMRNTAAMLRATDPRAPRMTDSDVKKLNDMQPYALELKLLATKGDTAFSQWVSFTVGVKTHMHLCDSQKLEQNIVDVLRNKNPTFNLIRWTTGEISLLKDIILHLDDINFEVANKSDRTGKLIASFKALKRKSLHVGPSGVNRIAPFGTLVISSNTYHDIKEKYGYDLKNMGFAEKVRQELFLMCFVIIDDATHTYDILVDGQHDFQTYSMETLEREVSMKSSKLSKELTRMLGSN